MTTTLEAAVPAPAANQATAYKAVRSCNPTDDILKGIVPISDDKTSILEMSDIDIIAGNLRILARYIAAKKFTHPASRDEATIAQVRTFHNLRAAGPILKKARRAERVGTSKWKLLAMDLMCCYHNQLELAAKLFELEDSSSDDLPAPQGGVA